MRRWGRRGSARAHPSRRHARLPPSPPIPHPPAQLLTPLTLLEAGFNTNYQKSWLRGILRNRGALAALGVEDKCATTRFFASAQLRGYGATWILMATRLRLGLHKHAKEGLACLFESCTAPELEAVVAALGGRRAVLRLLEGRLRLSRSFAQRLRDVEATHQQNPNQLAYQVCV